MGMGLTGYLLVWDQRAYWASVVGVNINGTAPVLGPFISKFLFAGPVFNYLTISGSTPCTCSRYPAPSWR